MMNMVVKTQQSFLVKWKRSISEYVPARPYKKHLVFTATLSASPPALSNGTGSIDPWFTQLPLNACAWFPDGLPKMKADGVH